ncbi:MAG: 16S rRNA (guanine(527)-N(7))-methyltransferase RsmG [Sulfuricaulis sp.]|uniref:16S rRNA (guanine(527)-N(7))-methyltransferase RsmG n=1 Tax=Sulfuricaulis sp. TaxID=2003553 RepID=UPI0025DC619E|nr:16S rRNA (guanine(527)-N(7))-methyltransferase RsmG [Sulfuricaulis sp.]MCR4345717.1 16S rRNA (guanine(527)-N(7))-methyltransferase RsmG [Sulfuricaulis sp.]
MKLEKRLQQGLREMGLELPPPAETKLLNFLELLEKWNKTYNLTAVRDPEQMVPRHLLDSLSVLPYLHGLRVLDIGTGAGLPGIPLALARPDLEFTLLDSNAKKTRFATQALHELGLKNVAVVQERVEKFHPTEKFDTLIARAFASIPDMLAASRHLCAPNGRFLVMKGVFPQEELAAVTDGYRAEVKQLTIPGLDAARHMVILATVN